jgi:trehalose 6-phosphate phosphatase
MARRRVLPSALEKMNDFSGRHQLALFLDYDGTLTEIVDDPDRAFLSKEIRSVIRRLSLIIRVAILSGRDVEDVRRLVNVQGIVYAGSHGFDIIDASGTRQNNPGWLSFLPSLDIAEKKLRETMKEIHGVGIDRKQFAIAVHYRNVEDSLVAKVRESFEKVASSMTKLRKSEGKKVLELLPDFEWNKGAALISLLKMSGFERKKVTPIFIGDDLTDESAFLAIHQKGIGIIVSEENKPATFARYSLRSPAEVKLFLKRLEVSLRK